MTLDQDKFEIRNLFRAYQLLWRDVSDFTTAAMGPRIPRFMERIWPRRWSVRLVVFNLTRQSPSALADFNVCRTGRNAGLPDTYGLSADDLAALMAEWRERALATARRRSR